MKPLEPNELFTIAKANPVVDVRTPAEFEAGHIPGAINIPLFTNEERAEVGTLYKQVSREKAMLRALDIVGPKMSNLVKQASKFKYTDKLIVHCWRGGMRSASFAWLMNTAGIPAITVNGGYKGFRRFAASIIKRDWNFKVITACTGSGKTELLLKLQDLGEQIIDLEGLADHKGSVFGGLGHAPQPTTEQFENNLFWAIKDFDINRTIWVEDESMCIGHVFIPRDFYNRMHFSPLVKVDLALDQRIERLVKEYALFSKEELTHAISKITKRLGGDNAKLAAEAIESGNFHEATRILLWYYDKAYNRSIEERRGLISFEKEYKKFDAEQIAQELMAKE
ncbi:tRNA 2-selenouridine(34) synthase MnmH [Perlabentimonas gracilis]|uniref:tRNA 2-selenouridine(34) synthase MnmH n=1 Tax=Perlabentimonas gracilis TaxID=2715279 RepID=UPI001409D099|nr:tRNA 2-selenouridine(34) synthase MnmH [Perlabentimonas gracilis]NHB69451.1 tRNA 2-selenouridine(34) synthase MnmH [Perlabentimonas gracilis]